MTKSNPSSLTQNRAKGQKPKAATVLGIDPGFDRVGVAVMCGSDLLYSDCIVTDRKESHEVRLRQIGEEVQRVIRKYSPNHIAMEKLFFNQNITTALKVAEARGVILYEAARGKLSLYEYSPQAVKIAVTGYGKANKAQVESMVRRLSKLGPDTKMLDDETDAIALCITHIASVKSI